jgi:hypothetical protein
MSESSAADAGGAQQPGNKRSPRDWKAWRKKNEVHLLAAYLVCMVAALIVLRVTVDDLDFLGVGWIVVLATLPLLPWLVPRFVQLVKDISPYVQSFKLGAVQFDLRLAQRTPPNIAAAAMQPALPNDLAALSAGTSISKLVNALRDLNRQGGSPIGVIDLQDGHKWRLPNLYFLARLLELEPVVRQLVFTEMKGGVDGYLVGSASPDAVRQRIEQAVPEYAAAAARLPRRDVPTLADPNLAQPVGADFLSLLTFLGPNSGRDDDPVFGHVSSLRLAQVAGPVSDVAVEGLGTTLTEEHLRTVVQSPVPFVPVTTGGRVTGVVDRDAVALAAARAAVAAS